MPKTEGTQEFILSLRLTPAEIAGTRYRLERACIDCNVSLRSFDFVESDHRVRFTGSDRCVRKFKSWLKKEGFIEKVGK